MKKTRTLSFVALALAAGGVLAGCTYEPKPRVVVDRTRARIDAVSRLMQAAESPDPATRACAIEAIADVLPDRAPGVVLQGLRDDDRMVRSAAAMAAGELELASAKARLQEMAMFKTKGAEPDKRVYAAVVGALHRLGDTKHSSDLRDLLGDPDEELVRAQAALALGLTKEHAAIDLLKRRLDIERSPLVTIQIVEAMARLGDAGALARLEGLAYLPTDSSVAAMEAAARYRTANASDLLRGIAEKPDQSPIRRAIAYGGLARLGETTDANYSYCLSAAQDPQGVLQKAFRPFGIKVEAADVTRLQRCAAVALGWMRRIEAVPELQGALAKAQDGPVRVSCAMSILRIVQPTSVAGRELPPPSPKAQAPAEPPQRKQPRKPQVHSAEGKD
ncbi:MAG: HEAT repeat domain-containing protein [Planctomycetota bacterium]|nr:HEAT repeat domain-containing protein [Planctomycetota bacterium]